MRTGRMQTLALCGSTFPQSSLKSVFWRYRLTRQSGGNRKKNIVSGEVSGCCLQGSHNIDTQINKERSHSHPLGRVLHLGK